VAGECQHCSNVLANPKGIETSSPGLRGTSYLGSSSQYDHQPQTGLRPFGNDFHFPVTVESAPLHPFHPPPFLPFITHNHLQSGAAFHRAKSHSHWSSRSHPSYRPAPLFTFRKKGSERLHLPLDVHHPKPPRNWGHLPTCKITFPLVVSVLSVLSPSPPFHFSQKGSQRQHLPLEAVRHF
jgi:hypothetical protein